MSEANVLFELLSQGSRLVITRNLSGQLVLSVEGCGVRASITAPGAQLYDLSDWIERYLDGADIERGLP